MFFQKCLDNTYHMIIAKLVYLYFANYDFKIDEELIPPEWIRNHQEYFGIIMNDNSMDPEFHKDDCLIIRENQIMDKDGFCVLEKIVITQK